jgi:proton-dependent oligopeptide transporter, POT family
MSGHPKILKTLFFTEMWERFSFYGMRALLVLYLVNGLRYQPNQALQVYAAYTALVYITPILGGYLADKYINNVNAIFLGGLLMMIGHFLLAFEFLFFFGLAFLVLGNGFFKPNISSLLSTLYKYKPESLRDEGFSFFYIGINLGAFFAPLIIGFVGESYSWHAGFFLAAFGMLIGLITFFLKISNSKEITVDFNRQLICKWFLALSAVLSIIVLVPWWLTLSLCLIVSSVIIYKSKSQQITAEETKSIQYILYLGIFSVIFWMGFEQAGGSLTLFTDTKVNRNLFNFTIPTTFFLAINPLIIITLGMILARLWTRLEKNYAITTPLKMSGGLFLLGLGFFVLAILQNKDQIHFSWIILIYFFHTLGELCLSPTSLSKVSSVAPDRLRSFMLGVWFLTFAIASYLAGMLPIITQSFNVNLFSFLAIISIVSCIVLIFLNKFINKLIL